MLNDVLDVLDDLVDVGYLDPGRRPGREAALARLLDTIEGGLS